MKETCLQFLIVITILISTSPARADKSKDFEPWSVTASSPTISSSLTHTDKTRNVSYISCVCFGWLSIYQNHMHVVIRSKCSMHPSCSTYSIKAIKKHGGPKGVILTFDRLIHEADENLSGYKIKVNKQLKIFDPVENNDFWWKK